MSVAAAATRVQHGLTWAWAHKEAIAGTVAALLAVQKLRKLAQAKHELGHGGSAAPAEIDARLFPQFIASASVPSLWLHTRCWEVPQPRCVVFITHGYGEHIGRYEALAARLNAAGASVYGLDHQGHGQSDGDRAHVERFSHYVTDALTFIEHVQKGRLVAHANKPLPCFLFGHSMGGLIATQIMRASYVSPSQPETAICAEDGWPRRIWPWTGCILSSPALAVDPANASPALLRVGKFVSDVLPKLQLARLSNNLSRVPAVLAQFESDALNWHGTMRARWGAEMVDTMAQVREGASAITWPMLIIQGDADQLVYPPGATFLHENAASTDKKLRVWPGAWHELFYELPAVQEQATREVTDWITQRSGGN